MNKRIEKTFFFIICYEDELYGKRGKIIIHHYIPLRFPQLMEFTNSFSFVLRSSIITFQILLTLELCLQHSIAPVSFDLYINIARRLLDSWRIALKHDFSFLRLHSDDGNAFK